MPTYSFRCGECGREFDILLIKKRRVRCPECGSERVKRLFKPFRLKGSKESCSSCSTDSGGGGFK